MLGSALAHAIMSMFNKRAGDILVFRGLFLGLSAVWLFPIILINPIPSWEVFRFLLLTAVVTYAFNMLLVAAFMRGEMNLVYPVMRGASPALTGVLAVIVLSEPLSPLSLIGLLIASLALIGFAWPERGGLPKRDALLFALAASVMTAIYSVSDASGVRELGDPVLYLAWFALLNASSLLLTTILRRPGQFIALAKADFRPALIASVLGPISYGLALYAYSIASVAPMAALRETSIVFGAILAAVVLKERFGLKRIALAICLAFGLVLLQAG